MAQNENELPEEVRRLLTLLGPQAKMLGLELPNEKDTVPSLCLRGRLCDIAKQCADNILSAGFADGDVGEEPVEGRAKAWFPPIFRQEHNIVTIDEVTGLTRLMTAGAFRSFAEHYQLIYEKTTDTGAKIPAVLGCEYARDILASEDFRCRLPRLRGVNMVKQPVTRPAKGGKPETVELLSPGYDRESEIFTVRPSHKELDYDETWTWERAEKYFEMFRFFPWGGSEGVDPLKLKGVSFSICVSAWLSLYGVSMLPKNALPPFFLFNANEPGSGKSRMVELIIFALYGYARTLAWPKDKKENDKVINNLDSLAFGGGSYLFIDNLSPGYFESPAIEAWVTNATHTARVFNTQSFSTVEKRCVTFITGNKITMSPDLTRRALICDFWATESTVDVDLPGEAIRITKEFIGEPKNRGEFLSALWAMIRHAGKQPKVAGKERRGFEAWSERIASINIACGLADPLTKRELEGTGDTKGQELKQLMTLVVEHYLVKKSKQACKVELLGDILPIARREGLFRGILFTTEDMIREMDRKKAWKDVLSMQGEVMRNVSQLTDMDKQMQAEGYIVDASMSGTFTKRVGGELHGKTARDKEGREYEFGKRSGARHSTFEIVRK